MRVEQYRERNILVVALENKIMIWRDGDLRTIEEEIIEALLTSVVCLGCSLDGKFIACLGDDGFIKAWQIDGLKKTGEKNIQTNKVNHIGFSYVNDFLYVGSTGVDGFIHVISFPSMESKIVVENKSHVSREFNNFVVSHTKNLLLVNLTDDYVCNYFIMFNMDAGRELWNSKNFSVNLDDGYQSKDTEHIALKSECGLQLFNLKTFQYLAEIKYESEEGNQTEKIT